MSMSSSDGLELSASEIAWLVHMLRRVVPAVRSEQEILYKLIVKLEHEYQRLAQQ